ncbi:hypothetical protein SOVF_072610 [Spinacia oleracea]|nr:hypothetical protein SOVF_072610 [Spinacia oleracea]
MVKKAAPKNPVAKKPEIDNSVAEVTVEAPRRRGRRPNPVCEVIPVAKESVSIKKNKKAGNPKTKDIELVPENEPIEEEQPNQLVLQNSSLVDVPQPESHQLQSQVLKEVGVDGLPIKFHGQWLLMRRDLDVVSAIHADKLFKIQASMAAQSHGDDILENSTYQKMVDELVDFHQMVKNLPNGWDALFDDSNNPVVTVAPQLSAVVPLSLQFCILMLLDHQQHLPKQLVIQLKLPLKYTKFLIL